MRHLVASCFWARHVLVASSLASATTLAPAVFFLAEVHLTVLLVLELREWLLFLELSFDEEVRTLIAPRSLL